jgi:recombination protein RecT
MSVHQVNEIMVGTQSKGKYGPWKEHFVEMGRKTVIRRLAKYLPLSVEFQTAVALDNMATGGKDQKLDTIDGEFMLVQDEDAPQVDADTGEISGAAQGAAQTTQAEPAAQQQAQRADDWQPSPEELEHIRQREIAEAKGTQAAGQQQPAARRARNQNPIE